MYHLWGGIVSHMRHERIKHGYMLLHTSSEETALEIKFKGIVLRKVTKYIICLNVHINTDKLSKIKIMTF